MQEVSKAWKDQQKETLVPESYVEITLNVGDPDAQADAASESNGEMPFSDASSLVKEDEKAPVLYETLERNIWVLNGTRKVMPDSAPYGSNGYVGNALSGDDTAFETIPTITIKFSKVYDTITPGITIKWSEVYGEYAEQFRVTAYNGETAGATITVENESITSIVYVDITNFDSIKVEVLKWSLPGHRARIESISIGIVKTYTKNDLMSYKNTLSADPLSAELPKSEIVFEIKNLDGEFNPDNPSGAEKYLMERQEVKARYGYEVGDSIEWILGGTYYMSEWETPQNGITATFTARDAIEFMSDTYTGTASGTLKAIAEAAFTQAELPTLPDCSNPWVIDSSLANITAPTGADLSDKSIAEVLQLVANAACCVFYQDRAGIMHIEPLADGETDYEINRFNSYENSELELTKQLKAVDVNDGAYTLSVGNVGETQSVSNPLIGSDRAETVANWVASYLKHRRKLSGEFRADPRLDALDRVTNENQFATNIVLVTQIEYSYNGAFRGNYEGRSGV